MLTVITGPMFSGKSSALLSMIKSNEIANNRIGIFKPSNDVRFSQDKIVTHNKQKIDTKILDKDSPYVDYHNHCNCHSLDVAFFDEAQFFNTEDFVNLVNCIIHRYNTEVVCAGLSMDSSGEPFGAMPSLLATADNIISLKAVCSKCKKIGTATRTFRKTNKAAGQVLVGGLEIYEPRCFKCWTERQIGL